jgi:hypothetical protein
VTPASFPLDPTETSQIYGFNLVPKVNGTTLDGKDQTIAIVDAFYDSTALSDLNTFDAQFSLPGFNGPNLPTFTQVGQTGGSPTGYSQNSGWAGETALDIEWAHAIAPKANILLVESQDNGGSLYTAVSYAASHANVVSMSWGGSEGGGSESTFTGHTGVVFVASSGDVGGQLNYPSSSPNVLSVGGTTLTLGGTTGYGSEATWSSAGGGPSLTFNKPSWQTAYSGTKRGTPDVSYDSDPNSGFYSYSGGSWFQVGGTSDAAPQWAGLVALANQGRVLSGLGTLDSSLAAVNGPNQLMQALYSSTMQSTGAFHDITSGSTSGSHTYTAVVGYDLATGLGTPKAQIVIPNLVAWGASTPTAPTITTQPTNQSVAAGQTASFTAAASGTPAPTVQWQVSTNGGSTWSNISGATTATYGFTTSLSDSGHLFHAVFTNASGSATTNSATLTVSGVAPTMSTQPAPRAVTVGQTASFTATANGTPNPTVQWQVRPSGSGVYSDIPGATSTTYTFAPGLSDSGSLFRAVFTNSAGSVTSNSAFLVVSAPVTIASIKVNDGLDPQRSEVRSITVTFTGSVTFAGAAEAAFRLTHVQTSTNVVLASSVTADGSGNTQVKLTFTGSETDAVSAQNGALASLADGRYTLSVFGSSITDANGAGVDANNSGTLGSTYTSPADTFGGTGLGLYRLFGDVTGDGVVDPSDLNSLRTTFNVNSTQTNYIAALDANNDGVVDPTDLNEFRMRFNTNVF